MSLIEIRKRLKAVNRLDIHRDLKNAEINKTVRLAIMHIARLLKYLSDESGNRDQFTNLSHMIHTHHLNGMPIPADNRIEHTINELEEIFSSNKEIRILYLDWDDSSYSYRSTNAE